MANDKPMARIDGLRAGGVESRSVERQAVIDFLRGFSIEASSHDSTDVARYGDLLAPGTKVYVNVVPGADDARRIETASRLRRAGFHPVPHIAARNLPSLAALEALLARAVGEAGIEEALVIAGDLDRARGPYQSSLQLLETGAFEKFGIRRIGVAGYPEGHPKIRPAELAAALLEKSAFADRTGCELYLVSQFCFDPAPIIAWSQELRRLGNRLPIRVGLAGLASLKTLIRFARRCGVRSSLRALGTHRGAIARLLTTAAPDALIAALAAYRAADPASNVVGAHFFPFGGLVPTAGWLDAILRGEFDMRDAGRGFDVRSPVV